MKGLSRFELAGIIVGTLASVALLVASFLHAVPIDFLEAIGFVTGGLCVWLGVKQNLWNWPIGIANNIAYIVVFFNNRLFADMSLQIAFGVLGAYGWYAWVARNARNETLTVSRTPPYAWIASAAFVALATAALTPYLQSKNDAAPFWDAITTTLSLAAQYLMTRKYLECWWVWISVDVISVGLYAVKDLKLTAVLYAIFLAMCVVGYRDWKASIAATRFAPARA